MLSKVVGIITALLMFSIAISGGTLIAYNLVQSSQENNFTAKVDFAEGTNHYKLVEIDEGDNNEEKSVTNILHEFLFSATGDSDSFTWDFGDGNSGVGAVISHQYELPGNYVVTATSISKDDIQTKKISVKVNFVGTAEVDNMECTCAPTAKDSVIDLMVLPTEQFVTGSVKVEHDGSSESCSLRNPLQECHLRVILQWTVDSNVVNEDVLFDETFRSDEVIVDFDIENLVLEQGHGLHLRLETDQLRDWHKPTAEWYNTVLA